MFLNTFLSENQIKSVTFGIKLIEITKPKSITPQIKVIFAQDCLERNILNIQEYTFIFLSSFSEHLSEISLAKSLETNEISKNQFRGLWIIQHDS